MALSDIVNVTITLESVRVTQAGFGIPLILASDCPAGFTERYRVYTEIGQLEDDGFSVTGATYLCASAIFAQDPHPTTVAVGRQALKPTLRWAVTPVATNSVNYAAEFNGNALSYDSDANATAAEIIAGLKSDIDALSLAVTVSDQTTYMRVVANSAGAWFNMKVATDHINLGRLAIAMDHADPGVATDLNAILDENPDFYVVLNNFNSQAMAVALAVWTEANGRMFICGTQDSKAISLSKANDTDQSSALSTPGALQKADYFRSAAIYHPDNSQFIDAAWAGSALWTDPGSETWAFKRLAGVDSYALTATQRTNLVAKAANFYETVAGVNVVSNTGTVASGEYIDTIRFRDWLKAVIESDIAAALIRASAAGKKIPYTDAGISTFQGIILARLQEGVTVGGLADDPAPKCTVPKASTVSTADKEARELNDVKFDGTLAGAVHSINISGRLSV